MFINITMMSFCSGAVKILSGEDTMTCGIPKDDWQVGLLQYQLVVEEQTRSLNGEGSGPPYFGSWIENSGVEPVVVLRLATLIYEATNGDRVVRENVLPK